MLQRYGHSPYSILNWKTFIQILLKMLRKIYHTKRKRQKTITQRKKGKNDWADDR